MRQLATEVVLQSTRERVWELLADFSLYPQWHPLFTQVTGSSVAGEQHELRVHLPGIDAFLVKARLVRSGDDEVSWQSTFLGRAFLTWTFSYRIEPLSPDRLKFQQRSRFGGLLAPLFRLALDRPLAGAMEEVNLAVRRWGEKGNVRCLRC